MAAAFAALVSLKNNLLLIQNHPRHSFSVDDKQIQSLLESVTFLIEFMKSYDNSHGAEKEAAEALESRIARAAEAAEDVIETHVVDQIRGGKTLSNTRSSLFLLDVQKVIQGMDYMRRKAINVKARSRAGPEQPTYSYSAVAASSKTHTKLASEKTTMVGFDAVFLRLLDLLTGVPFSRRAIPIVGMGGIGKTTLARYAFKDPFIDEHFDICLWATISQQYWVEKILTQLVSGLKKSTTNNANNETVGELGQLVSGLKKSTTNNANNETVGELGQQLYQSLFGRRYLIILDDMWTLQAWDEIKNFFPETNNGSRIVVTTRHTDVAKHVGTSRLSLSFLDEDNSWDLFCKKAFSEQGCPPALEEVGKKIVAKCKGLPLAIVVVGGHLRKSSMTLEYWENVAQDMNSILYAKENDEQCSNILSLSYSYLPAHLKPCFLLLGAFPEDEYIHGWKVRTLWISEGLIEPTENTIMEVVAEDYLLDLYERNLILVDGLGFDGKIVDFKLHDVIRELCIKIGKRERFLSVLDSSRAINRGRRVVINGGVAEVNRLTKTLDASIRCLIYKGDWPSNDLKLLRTLNRVVPQSTNVSIFQQVNLRFLKVDLRATPFQTLYLPSSISQLWNLQTLQIYLPYSSTVMILPYEIWEMMQLRHLEVHPIRLVDPLPEDRRDERKDLVLRHLHTLFEVENFRLSEEAYKRIPNIREMFLLYSHEASSYYCPQNLCKFCNLKFLSCDFDLNSNWCDFALSLTFPSSLTRLFLTGCRVDWKELTMKVGSLPHLISLGLFEDAVVGSVWTTVNTFLSLKELEICDCDDIVIWNVESSHFPVLEALKLNQLSKLDEFPLDMGEIPTLRSIELGLCSIASTFSAMRTLMEQEEQGNDDLKLHVFFEGDDETLEKFNNQVEEDNLRSKNLYVRLYRLQSKSF